MVQSQLQATHWPSCSSITSQLQRPTLLLLIWVCVCVLATSLLRGPAKVQLEEVPDVPILNPVVEYLTVSQSYEPSVRRATLDTHTHTDNQATDTVPSLTLCVF